MFKRSLFLFLLVSQAAFGQSAQPQFDRLSKLRDVSISSPLDTQVLTYDFALGKWKNAAGGSGGGISLSGENYLSLAGTVLTANAVNLGGSNATGTLAAGREPAHTGDVTNSAGSLALSLVAGNAGNLNSGTLLAARMPALTGDVTTSAGSIATTLAAGNAGNLNSGTLLAARMPALTGDVTSSAGSIATTLANIPDLVTQAGSILATNIAAPATPALGKNKFYFDSTSKNLAAKNDAGTVNHGIQSRTATASNWIRSILDDGTTAISQPAFTDIPGNIATTQGGLPTGGSTAQMLTKNSATNYDTGWTTPISGPGSSVDSNLVRWSGTTGLILKDSTAGTQAIWTNSGELDLFRDDANNSVTSVLLTLNHTTTGSPAIGIGSRMLFTAETNARLNDEICDLISATTNIGNGTVASYFAVQLETAGSLTEKARIWGSGGMSVNNTTDPGAGIISANTGYWIGTAASTSGKLMQSNGSQFGASTPTWPTAGGTSGYEVRTDGTNYSAYPAQLINSSTSSVSASYASDIYLAGSSVVVAAGDFKAKGQYHCVFDMVKTGAGVATPIINVRIGTAGTTGDTSRLTFTFGAGTGVIDTGHFEVWVNWRTVGSGTSAVVQGICKGEHNLATTGLFNNAATWTIVGTPSAGFDSSTATTIGVSFNGGSLFSGTNTLVQATIEQ